MPLPDFTSGQVLTAAQLDAAFAGLFGAGGGGGWTGYTPTFGSSSGTSVIGNGSIAGTWFKVERFVAWRIQFTAGTTTTYGTGHLLFGLPTGSAQGGLSVHGRATLTDASAGTRNNRDVCLWTATTCLLISEAGATVTGTVPWTWANGDTVQLGGTYESAA